MLSQPMMVLLATATACALACGSGSETSSESHDEPTSDDSNDDTTQGEGGTGSTGATCPTKDPPTYENFGKAFMAAYCTRCHDSALTGAARNGATTDFNFDTLEGVLASIDDIEDVAASGPAATNTLMPPTGSEPTVEERTRLGTWLACSRVADETAN